MDRFHKIEGSVPNEGSRGLVTPSAQIWETAIVAQEKGGGGVPGGSMERGNGGPNPAFEALMLGYQRAAARGGGPGGQGEVGTAQKVSAPSLGVP
jgi:hypothetical protein